MICKENFEHEPRKTEDTLINYEEKSFQKNDLENVLELSEEEQKKQTKFYQRATNLLYHKLEYKLLEQLVNKVSQPRRNKDDVIDISILNKVLELYNVPYNAISDFGEEKTAKKTKNTRIPIQK